MSNAKCLQPGIGEEQGWYSKRPFLCELISAPWGLLFPWGRCTEKPLSSPLVGIFTSSIWGSGFRGGQITRLLTAVLISDVSSLVISPAGANHHNFKQTAPTAPTNTAAAAWLNTVLNVYMHAYRRGGFLLCHLLWRIAVASTFNSSAGIYFPLWSVAHFSPVPRCTLTNHFLDL